VAFSFNKLLDLVSEKNQQTKALTRNSDPKRKKRSKNVRITSLQKYTPSTTEEHKPLPKGWKRWEYVCESAERTEDREHQGYVVIDKVGSVKDVYCSCGDFQFRWRYALSQGDDKAMASNIVPDEYKDVETKAPYSGTPSDITNPKYLKRLCKHLLKILDKIALR
jgi:hypothetical protein